MHWDDPSVEKYPAVQLLHTELAETLLNLPAAQTTQVVKFPELEIVPGLHAAQMGEESVAANLPAEHVTHTLLPVPFVVEPAKHFKQVVCPMATPMVPLEQAVHVEAPDTPENVPMSQTVQATPHDLVTAQMVMDVPRPAQFVIRLSDRHPILS